MAVLVDAARHSLGSDGELEDAAVLHSGKAAHEAGQTGGDSPHPAVPLGVSPERTGAVGLTAASLRVAMCDLAVSYSDPQFQRLLMGIRENPDFLTLLREVTLPRQATVLERLGLPATSEGLAMLEAKVLRCIFKEKDVELQRMANGASQLLKLPPVSTRLPDPLRSGPGSKASDPVTDPLEVVVQQGERPSFWRSLCPWLHVVDVQFAETVCSSSSSSLLNNSLEQPGPDTTNSIATLKEDLQRDGYFVSESASLSWAVNLTAVARGVTALVSLGLPPELVLAFDEPWLLASELQPLARELTGATEVVFEWTVHCGRAGNTASPAVLHGASSPGRGCGLESSTPEDLQSDGSPRCVTFWIPLTDSTTRSSCLMVMPRPHDAGYGSEGVAGASDLCSVFQVPEDFQHITALPVEAGGLAGLSQRLFHWHSTPDPGQEPRVALALTAAGTSHKQSAFRDPASMFPLPPLEVRIALAASSCLMWAMQAETGKERLSSLEQLEALSELYQRCSGELSEALDARVLCARSHLYEELHYLEGGPTDAQNTSAEPLALFESAVARDPPARTDVSSLSPELGPPVDPFELLAARGDDRKFWQDLCPWLHVADETMLTVALHSVIPCMHHAHLEDQTLGLKEDLIRNGYFCVESGVIPWAVDIAGVARGIMALVGRGFPAVSILMYDEPWVLAAQLEQLAYVATGGNELSFDWAAFCVRAKSSKPAVSTGDKAARVAPAGWPPHRDRGSNNAGQKGFRADGSPRYTTFWIPLTDATPRSSCLHVVPKPGDPGYRAGDGRHSAIQNVFRRPDDFRRIRAVPLGAGGLLGFSHRIFHWGSAADSRAPAPRVAIAFPAVDPEFEPPLFPDPAAMRPMPPLDVRLSLVAAQVLVYASNEQHLVSLNRLQACWSIFNMHSAHFRPSFVQGIKETNTVQHQRLFHEEQQTPFYMR